MSIKEIVYKIIEKFKGKENNHQKQIEGQVEKQKESKSDSEPKKKNKQTKKKKTKKRERDLVERKPIDEEKLKYLSETKTKIYCDRVNDDFIDEISKNEVLSEYEKTIILLAICEKSNMLKRAKQIKDKANIEKEEQKREINKIVERIKSNKIKRFDLGKYDVLLGWKLDEELLDEYSKQENDNQKGSKIPNQEEHNLDENQASMKQEVFVGKEKQDKNEEGEDLSKKEQKKSKELKEEQDKEQIQKENKEEKIELDQHINNKSGETKKKEISNNINIILEYLKEKRVEIYIRTETTNTEARKKAIKQLDVIQELIEKMESGKKDEKYIENMYKKIKRLKEIEEKQNGEYR